MVLISIEQSGHFSTCQQSSGCHFICLNRPQIKLRELSFLWGSFIECTLSSNKPWKNNSMSQQYSAHLVTWNNFNGLRKTLTCFVVECPSIWFIPNSSLPVRAWLGLIRDAEKYIWPFLPWISYHIIRGKEKTRERRFLLKLCVFVFLQFVSLYFSCMFIKMWYFKQNVGDIPMMMHQFQIIISFL